MKYKISKKTFINILFSVIIGILVVSGVIYAWTDPSQEPPTSNLPPPINTGPIAQHKEGSLSIGGGLGVGTMSPAQRLQVVDGRALADDFCLNSNPEMCLSGTAAVESHCIERWADELLSSSASCRVVNMPGYCSTDAYCRCPSGYTKTLTEVLYLDWLLSDYRDAYYTCDLQ